MISLQEFNQTYNRTWSLPLAIVLLCCILQFCGLSNDLRFDRDAIAQGNWWLLLSGNFVHIGFNHLLLNIAGLWLIYFLLWSNYNTTNWLFILVLSSMGVGLGLYALNPELRWYVGLSGTLHGLIIAGAIADCRRYPKTGALLLILVSGKLAWEQFFGALPGSAEVAGGNVIVDSHFYGAITGAICTLMIAIWFALKQRTVTTS